MSERRYTYVMAAPAAKRVKIGGTWDFPRRSRELQLVSPVVLHPLFVFGYDCEVSLHDRFRKYQLHGEWFDARGELAEWIWELYSLQASMETPFFAALPDWTEEDLRNFMYPSPAEQKR